MSLLDVWVNKSRILLGVDTELRRPGGEELAGYSASKFLYLPRLNALLAGAGWLSLHQFTRNWCESRLDLDLDGLIDALPGELPHLFEQFVKHETALGAPDSTDLDAQHLVLLGWSTRHASMIGRQWVQTSRKAGFEGGSIEPYFVSPGGAEMRSTPAPNTVGRMVELARAQRDWVRQYRPGAPAGGRFLVAELTRRRCVIEDVFDLDADAGYPAESERAVFAGGGVSPFGALGRPSRARFGG